MANKVPEHLASILQAIGETPNTALWDCHGTWVVKHKALQKVASTFNFSFKDAVVIETDINNKSVALMVRGERSFKVKDSDKIITKSEWSIGEASPYNNKNGYPYAMAEKRAKDRVILKLIGISGEVYSEEEADDFKNSKPRGV